MDKEMYLIVMMNYYSLVIGRMVREKEKERNIEKVSYYSKVNGEMINQMVMEDCLMKMVI